MSSVPGEVPGFDFESVMGDYFDAERIAEQVAWPLINHFWRGDWRDHSKLNHELLVQKGGVYVGKAYDVTLSASNELAEHDEDPETGVPIIKTARIEVEEITHDERRDLIMDEAHEDDTDIDPDEPEDYTAKVITAYTFDTDGDYDIDSCRVVEELDGGVAWHSNYQLTQEEPQHKVLQHQQLRKFMGHDIELISAGVYFLNPSSAIAKALKLIKNSPVK